jgi:hypothetical protein
MKYEFTTEGGARRPATDATGILRKPEVSKTFATDTLRKPEVPKTSATDTLRKPEASKTFATGTFGFPEVPVASSMASAAA